MAEFDCELTRLRVDREMKLAIDEAARRQGITASAWRKVAYANMLNEQLGPSWRKPRGSA
jgi:hypothetical protein